MDEEWINEEIEYELWEGEEEYYYDPDEYSEPPLYPDPIFIGAITIVFCLVVFGLLTKFTLYVFGPAASTNLLTQAIDQKTNDDSLDNSSSWDGECQINAQYPAKITRWCDLITQYSAKHNLDPDLIAALIWLESGGNEVAYSHSGAVGLMQIMPRDGLAASFMCVNGPCFKDRPSTDELRNPESNIAFGTRYLSSLIRKNGNLREALKSYGPMDAGYTYSDKVLSIFNRFNDN